MTEDEKVGWHHQLDRHEFEQALGVGDGQGSLACSARITANPLPGNRIYCRPPSGTATASLQDAWTVPMIGNNMQVGRADGK